MQGVSNGVVVESTIVSMQTKEKPFDFVLCIIDDQSDAKQIWKDIEFSGEPVVTRDSETVFMHH